jgi:hypothetical protein
LRVFAAPLAPDAGEALVVVEIGGAHVALAERDGMFAGQVEVLIAASDAAAAVMTPVRHALNLTLSAESADLVLQRGVRLVTRHPVAPGGRQLRVAASVGDGRAGSVVYPLEATDIMAPLAISPVMMTSWMEGRTPTIVERPAPGMLQSGSPVAVREFQTDDELELYAEIRKRAPAAPRGIQIATSVLREDGEVVTVEREVMDAHRADERYTYRLRLQLGGYAPGRYVIAIEARAVGDAAAVARRAVSIRVR